MVRISGWARERPSSRGQRISAGRVRASDESGQILVVTGIALVLMLCSVGLVVDVGHAMLVQRQLQAGADAAALAGAQHLPEAAVAESVAVDYSARPGEKNAVNTVDNAETHADAVCIEDVLPVCPTIRYGDVNSIKVWSQSVVPTWFGRIIGINSMTVNAEATACSPCSMKELDIMIVIDRTGSMCHDPTTGQNVFPRCDKLDEAKRGARRFLEFMDPSLDRVGLALFPPALDASWVSSCPTPNGWGSNGYRPWTGRPNRNVSPTTLPEYDFDGRNYGYAGWYPWWDLTDSRGQTPNRYVLAELEGAGNTPQPYLIQVGPLWQLNPASALVQRIDCASANGTTSYHLALESAQHHLNNSGRGRPGAQNVIIFLSDGAANTMPTNIPPSHWSNSYLARPCAAGVFAANLAKTSNPGTIIYTIGYGLDTGGGGPERCLNPSGGNEVGGITSDSALAAMASSPLHYFRVGATADLEGIFRQIALDLSGSRGRLIDNDNPSIP